MPPQRCTARPERVPAAGTMNEAAAAFAAPQPVLVPPSNPGPQKLPLLGLLSGSPPHETTASYALPFASSTSAFASNSGFEDEFCVATLFSVKRSSAAKLTACIGSVSLHVVVVHTVPGAQHVGGEAHTMQL